MTTVLVANRFDSNTLIQLQQQKSLQVFHAETLTSLKQQWPTAKALICRSQSKITTELLELLPQLQIIITATSGFDHIDLNACKKKNITVMHTPEANVESAAELTLAHMLNARRHLQRAHQNVHAGQWQRAKLIGTELCGSTVGLIGYGRIGQRVAALLKPFAVDLLVHDPYLDHSDHPDVQFCGFEELVRSSQIVSMHVPLTSETRHMIKESTLDWFLPDSLLVNASRGAVVCLNGLFKHLQQNPTMSVALDVFPNEPLPTDSPLLQLDNLSLSPHIGASTHNALKKASAMAAEKLIAYLNDNKTSDTLPPTALWADKILNFK